MSSEQPSPAEETTSMEDLQELLERGQGPGQNLKADELEDVIDAVIHLLREQRSRLSDEKHANIYHCLAERCIKAKRLDEAVEYAELWFNSVHASHSEAIRSDALYLKESCNLQLIKRKINQPFLDEQSKQTAFHRMYRQLETTAENLGTAADEDKEHGRYLLYQLKCELAFDHLDTMYAYFGDKQNDTAPWRLEWARELEASGRQSNIATLAKLILVKDLPSHDAVAIADRGLASLEASATCSESDKAQAIHLCAMARRITFDLRKDLSDNRRHQLLLEGINLLDSEEELLDSCSLFDEVGIRMVEWYLPITLDLIKLEPEGQASRVKAASRLLKRVELATTRLRESLLQRGSQENILARMREQASNEFRKQFYQQATKFYLTLGMVKLAWFWNQQSRSRAISAYISQNGVTAPESVSEASNRLHTTDDVVQGSQDHIEHDGPRDLPWPSDFFSTLQPGIVLVDWYEWPSKKLSIFVVDPRSKSIAVRNLEMTCVNVSHWIKVHLQNPQTKHFDDVAIEELAGLIEGLDELTQKDDTIVFVPSTPMRFVPLQAIPIGANLEPLIKRNAVIINSSVSAYQLCLRRSIAQLHHLDRVASFLAVYQESDEWAHIQECAKAIAKTFDDSRVLLGDEVHRDVFLQYLEQSSWFHFHGHGHKDDTDPLGQALVLCDAPPSTVGDISSAHTQEQAELSSNVATISKDFELLSTNEGRVLVTARDMFGMSLHQNAPFVCAIACDFHDRSILAGDEPLGIISALFIAGASSVLGTLWPVKSSAGRIFSKHFYEHVKQQQMLHQADQQPVWIDLAQAARHATLKLRADTEKKIYAKPSVWASFGLHGSGCYRFR